MPKLVTADLSNNADPCVLRYTTLDHQKLHIQYDRFDADIISHTYDGDFGLIIFNKPIKVIGEWAFDRCYNLSSITLPNSIARIGSGAFCYCSSLTSITIPQSVTQIDDCAFAMCRNLTSITIFDGDLCIGSIEVFDGCDNLAEIFVNITNLAKYCNGNYTYCFPGTKHLLIGNNKITKLEIPDSVTSIGRFAFEGCSLTSIKISDNIYSIGEQAFKDCNSLTTFYGQFASEDNRCLIINGVLNSFASAGLTEYTIPNSVTSIGNDAFSYCSHLTNITIPNSVTSIGNDAFSYCSHLTNITIPNSVTKIGKSAFYRCGSLTSINIPNSVISIGDSAFSGCCGLSSTTIPKSVTSIGNSAFYNCTGELIINCDIPDGVEYYYGYDEYECYGAFHHSKFEKITIDNSVTSIGKFAFMACFEIKTIVCKTEAPPKLGKRAFSDIPKDAVIIIPKGCEEAYMNSDWRFLFEEK